MLQITKDAANAIQTITTTTDLPEDAGLRVTTVPGAPEFELAVSMETEPTEQDEIVEDEGARVFLGPGAASYLEDKVLDAEVDDRGRVKFVVLAA